MSEFITNEITSNHENRLLTANDVVRILNVSRAFAYQLMQRGEIPTVHLGRSRRVIPDDLKRYISQNRFKDQDQSSSLYS